MPSKSEAGFWESVQRGKTMTEYMGIEVGKIYPGFKKGSPEGVKFDFGKSGALMVLAYDRPDIKEISNVRRGRIKAGIVVCNGISFVLVKFGSLNWIDAPYHSALSKDFELTPINNEKEGYAWSIVMLDNGTGIVKVIRFVTMPNKMSTQLHDIIDLQRGFVNSTSVFDQEAYDRGILEVYRKISTDELVKHAVIEEV